MVSWSRLAEPGSADATMTGDAHRMATRDESSRSTDTEVAILGAGPYGLAIAAHLSAAGMPLQIFGRPMSYWAESMPPGMLLRSSWDASHISSPDRRLSLDRYQMELGRDIGRPIPRETFVDYGRWFQEHAAPHLQERMVDCVQRGTGGFRLTLEDGARVNARRVVVATGLEGFAAIPPVFEALPPARRVHTANLTDLSVFRGHRVAVIGGGQAALESAALVSEAGACVEIFARSPAVRWLARSMQLHKKAGIAGRLLYPPTDVGPPILNQIVARPHLWKKLPKGVGVRVAYRSIRPAGAGWLVPRLKDVPIRLACCIQSAEETRNGVLLRMAGGSTHEVDMVVMGTGFSIEARRYSFISRDILSRLRLNSGYPVLARGFESSVPGLHFVGAPAAVSFGPLVRFVS